jgi:hypothetical protein
VAIQETNPGTEPATYLEFVATAIGKDFDTSLQQLPSA